MRGRKLIPDEIKQLKGETRPHRQHPDALRMNDLVNLPNPPKSLKGVGRDIYFDTGEKLLFLRVLNSLNISNFILYCFSSYLCQILQVKINNARNVEQLAHLMRMYSEATKNTRTWAVEFGLTPSSSGKVTVPKKDDKSKFQKYLDE